MCLNDLPDVQHPYVDYSLKNAVSLARTNAQTFERKVPETLEEVREYIDEMAARSGFNWLTGAAALDVLDVAIDGKDLSKGCRYC